MWSLGWKKHSKLTTHKHYRNLNQVHQNSTVSDIRSIVLGKIPEAYPIITPSEIPNMISTWNVSKTQEKEAFHKTRVCHKKSKSHYCVYAYFKMLNQCSKAIKWKLLFISKVKFSEHIKYTIYLQKHQKSQILTYLILITMDFKKRRRKATHYG